LLKRMSFLHHIFLTPFSKLVGHSWVDSYPGPLFCSTGLHICFCASTMLFLLLWLCKYSLKSGIVIPPALFSIVLVICGLLCS
jgi:hypothetical protein